MDCTGYATSRLGDDSGRTLNSLHHEQATVTTVTADSCIFCTVAMPLVLPAPSVSGGSRSSARRESRWRSCRSAHREHAVGEGVMWRGCASPRRLPSHPSPSSMESAAIVPAGCRPSLLLIVWAQQRQQRQRHVEDAADQRHRAASSLSMASEHSCAAHGLSSQSGLPFDAVQVVGCERVQAGSTRPTESMRSTLMSVCMKYADAYWKRIFHTTITAAVASRFLTKPGRVREELILNAVREGSTSPIAGMHAAAQLCSRRLANEVAAGQQQRSHYTPTLCRHSII